MSHPELVAEMKTDVLVVGSEGTGARAAIELNQRGVDVILATKGIMGGSGATLTAPYSCLVAFGHEDPRDNPDVHFRDTVIEGRLINNQKLVEAFTETAPQAILDLEGYGAKFDKRHGKFRQELMPGCTYPRAVFFDFSTGLQFRKGLMMEVKKRGIDLREDFFVIDLFTSRSEGRIVGALALDIRTGCLVVVQAKAVVLATGGAMELYYPYTDAPVDLTGDGMALAYRVGAELVDMEFMQFFPTVGIWPPALMGNLYVGQLRYKLAGRLYNKYGERFMKRYDPQRMEFTTRDRMSIAIANEILAGRGSPHGGVYLDVSYLPENVVEAFVEEYFHGWHIGGVNLLEIDLDLRRKAVEVAPMAHFQMGGIRINEHTETNIPGFYAAGETAGGVHGANRLEGNALSETQAFGLIAGAAAAGYAKQVDHGEINPSDVEQRQAHFQELLNRPKGLRYHDLRKELQKAMWAEVGLLRNRDGLQRAIARMEDLEENYLPQLYVQSKTRRYNREWFEAVETENMLLVGQMIARAAAAREESRGAHYRQDFPFPDVDRWLVNQVIRQDGDKMVLERVPLVITKLQPEESTALEVGAVAGNPYSGD